MRLVVDPHVSGEAAGAKWNPWATDFPSSILTKNVILGELHKNDEIDFHL